MLASILGRMPFLEGLDLSFNFQSFLLITLISILVSCGVKKVPKNPKKKVPSYQKFLGENEN